MKISVKSITGKQITIDVEGSDTVAVLKEKLVSFANAPVERLKLVVTGKVLLDNSKALADYGVKENDCLALIISSVAASSYFVVKARSKRGNLSTSASASSPGPGPSPSPSSRSSCQSDGPSSFWIATSTTAATAIWSRAKIPTSISVCTCL